MTTTERSKHIVELWEAANCQAILHHGEWIAEDLKLDDESGFPVIPETDVEVIELVIAYLKSTSE